MRTAALAASCLGLLVASLSAQGPRATVQTIDGREVNGALSFDGKRLVVGDAQLELGDALSVRVDAGARERVPAPKACVWLRSGGVLPCTSLDGVVVDGVPRLRVETASGARLELPLTTIAALRSRANDPQTFAQDRAAPDENRDYLYVVKDGSPQRFGVVVERVEEGAVHFDLKGSKYDFPLVGEDSVAAVVFGKNTGFAPNRRGNPRVQVEFVGGEKCGGELLEIGDSVKLRLDEGAEFAAPARRLASMEIETDKLLWLSSAKPRVEQTAAFDRIWPWTADRSPVGDGIVLGGTTYQRGLVLVPRTRLTYELGGRFDRFEAVLGLEARSGPEAHAVLRVHVDGKMAFEAAFAGPSSPAQRVSLAVPGAKEIVLEADFGENFDLGDLCAFADARVVRGLMEQR